MTEINNNFIEKVHNSIRSKYIEYAKGETNVIDYANSFVALTVETVVSQALNNIVPKPEGANKLLRGWRGIVRSCGIIALSSYAYDYAYKKSHSRNMGIAREIYYEENGVYPPDLDDDVCKDKDD